MRPTSRVLYALLVWAVLGFGAHFMPAMVQAWYAVAALLLLLLGVDAARLWLPLRMRLERQVAGVWPVDVWNTATITLHNEGARSQRIEVFDDYPAAWQMEGLPHATTVKPGAYSAIRYRLCPNARGDAQFGAAHLRVTAPWGFWLRVHRIGPSNAVKVFPDFSKLLGHTITATDRRVRSAGLIRKRQRGEGTDFRQLREYRQGDSLRAMDWKATARQQKPIVREYQESRDQQVIFLLDSGRRMLAKDHTSSHFDHALNAVLTLGFLAQKQGDAVGLMAFGASQRWLAPHKGRVGLDRLLAGIYDLQASEIAPDYVQAASLLMQHLSKRAFVVFITNLRDEDDQAMRTACTLLSSKHLVLCASLREASLDGAANAPVQQFTDALRSASTALYLQQRQEAIARLGLRAQHLLDTTPAQLSMALVNRYMDIKESGRL
jgi:uncharacterized protein (DUF58 family)